MLLPCVGVVLRAVTSEACPLSVLVCAVCMLSVAHTILLYSTVERVIRQDPSTRFTGLLGPALLQRVPAVVLSPAVLIVKVCRAREGSTIAAMRISRSARRRHRPPELEIDPLEPDWDYSVAVVHPNDESLLEEEEELKAWQGEELYNSIIEEDDDNETPLRPPVRFSRTHHDVVPVVDGGMCPTWTTTTITTQQEPETLFYKTYRHKKNARPKQQRRPEPICPALLLSSKFCVPAKSSSSSSSSSVHPQTKETTVTVTNAPPGESSCQTKPRRVRNSATIPQRRALVRASNIPPPQFPLAAISIYSGYSDTNDREDRLSPTSITDIFADLEHLQHQLVLQGSIVTGGGSTASTTVASTILGSSIDEDERACEQNVHYDTNEDTSPYHEDDHEYKYENSNHGSCSYETSFFSKETSFFSNETSFFSNETSFGSKETSFVSMDEDTDRTTAVSMSVSASRRKAKCHNHHNYYDDTRNHNRGVRKIVIDNNGRKVLSWQKHPPVVITNNGKAVFKHEIREEQDEPCFSCPTVAEL